MVVWKLKGCPRCGGDVFIDREFDVWYAQCLQCSHRHEVNTVAESRKQPVTAGAERSNSER
jgi:ribosomal protein S27AE